MQSTIDVQEEKQSNVQEKEEDGQVIKSATGDDGQD